MLFIDRLDAMQFRRIFGKGSGGTGLDSYCYHLMVHSNTFKPFHIKTQSINVYYVQ